MKQRGKRVVSFFGTIPSGVKVKKVKVRLDLSDAYERGWSLSVDNTELECAYIDMPGLKSDVMLLPKVTTTAPEQTKCKRTPLKNGRRYTVKGMVYQVVNKTSLCFVKTASKSIKTLNIPDEVTIKGGAYPVVSVGKKACYGYKKLSKVTVGKHCMRATAHKNYMVPQGKRNAYQKLFAKAK